MTDVETIRTITDFTSVSFRPPVSGRLSKGRPSDTLTISVVVESPEFSLSFDRTPYTSRSSYNLHSAEILEVRLYRSSINFYVQT